MIKGLSLAFATAILLCSQICWAQSTSQGAITGTVVDENENVIPSANIVVLNVETNLSRTATSNEQGDFRVDFLPPGKYQVTAERAGFKRTVADVTVQVSTVSRTKFVLSVGDVSEAVTVTGAESTIDTESPVIGEVIDNSKIQNLPLNGREFLQLAGLVPGANSGLTKRGGQAGPPFGPQSQHSVGFNGARSSANAYFVDGADSRAPDYNQPMASPALDAIKEFRVETNLYSAQYGRSGGGVINVVTNSGSNAIHGTIYEYHRNKALDAAPFFDHRSYDDRAPYLFNQFGGSIGGPVYLPALGEGGPALWSGRDKTFFFASLERYREKKPGQLIVSFAPTAKERIGDFSESINPWTGKPVVIRNPYTGQIIADKKLPPELITNVGRTLMALFPEPNFSGDPFLNYRTYRSGTNDQNKWLFRMDHNLTPRDTLSGTFNFSEYLYTNVSMTKWGDKSEISRDKSLILSYTRVLTNTLVNELKFNLNRYNSGNDFVQNDKNYGAEWGVAAHKAPGPPRILLYSIGYASSAIGDDGSFLRDNEHLFLKNNLAWVKGKHTFRLGGEFKQQRYLWQYDSGFAAHLIGLLEGDPVYGPYYDATGYSWATLLAGLSTYSYIGAGEGRRTPMSRKLFGFYGQDDWKVNPRLTLTFGLRWDYDPPFNADNNEFITMNFETGLPVYAAGAPADKLSTINFPHETGGPNRPYDPNKTDFAPRFGFAYKLSKDSSTVLRGGYGIYYTTETAWTTTYGSWAIPFNGIFYYYSRGWAWPDGRDRFHRIDQEPPDVAIARGKSPGYSQVIDPYYPSSYMQQWNLTLSRDFKRKLGVEIGYVGSKGTNLNGYGSLSDFSEELSLKQQARVPGWSIALYRKGFNSNYHSLQAKARKDLSSGLSFLAAYTWGHALAEASNESINENSVNDVTPEGRRQTTRRYSNADFDVRHRFTLSGIYQLPIGRGRSLGSGWSSLVNGIVGNWDLNYILTMQSGFPYSVRTSSLQVPDRICDGNLPSDQRTPDRWFDVKCFVDHAPREVTLPDGSTRLVNQVGNAGANIIRGPRISNLDLGIHKNFPFSESKRIELRMESFNVLNHPQFVGPAGYATYFINQPYSASLTNVRNQRSIQGAIKFIW
jgi:hypothetical protein